MSQNISNSEKFSEKKQRAKLSKSWTTALIASAYMALFSAAVFWPCNTLDWIIVAIAVVITFYVVYFAVKPYYETQ